MTKDLFEIITDLQLQKDPNYYDEDYGEHKFKILNDISLMEAVSRIDKFNKQYGRKIIPQVSGNDMFVFL